MRLVRLMMSVALVGGAVCAGAVHVDDSNDTGTENGTLEYPYTTIQGGYVGGANYPTAGDFSDANRDPDPATNETVIDGVNHPPVPGRNYRSVVDELILDGFDGIAQEAIWYDGSGGFDDWDETDGYDEPTEQDVTDYYLGHLPNYQAAGLPVFNCEYARAFAPQVYNTLSPPRSFIPYCTRRSLGQLTDTPPPGY